MKTFLYCLLAAPPMFIVGFFAYVAVTNDAGCGSQEPGACFAFGILTMVVAPFAAVTLPLLIIFLIRDALKRRKNTVESS